MSSARAVNWFLRRVFQTVCRIDVAEFKRIPRRGPYIMIGNHINFLEAPVVAPHIDSPMFTAMAKKESWNNPLFHFLFDQWGIIPLDREGLDREAFARSVEALNQGKILAISPEGTRSKTGRLLQGKPGVTALAVRSQAPMLPVAFYGYEDFWANLKRLRRTDFHVKVGRPFRLSLEGTALSREVRQALTDEMMYKLAELLPEQYRGYYRFDQPPVYRYVADI